ncbi:MAG: KamA family radical SAM protein [Aquificae bacterium]|nr:KamA family radical SAM protein [Aquificota bacterium]
MGSKSNKENRTEGVGNLGNLLKKDSKYWNDWRWQLKNRIKTPQGLKKYFKNLTEDEEKGLKLTAEEFPIAVTPYYLSLADPYNPECPIRKQVVPRYSEIDPKIQISCDPNALEEEGEIPHLTHRYPDRVLITLTTMCPVYCRHCMRKRKVGKPERAITEEEFKPIWDYIKKQNQIREVLISGGDPLVLSNEKLFHYIRQLKKIDHIEVIRIGTRTPVILPQRFYDDELLRFLEEISPVWIVTHFNHPKEITEEVSLAVKNIRKTANPVLNQTVLLKGINDNPQTMEELFRGLIRIGVKPYYLFHCDPIYGVVHFRTPIEVGLKIMSHLRGRVSGLAQPIYALDLPHGKGKVVLSPQYLVKKEGRKHYFRNYEGEIVEYEF